MSIPDITGPDTVSMAAFEEASEFVKNDAGKVRFELLPAEATLERAKAFTHGAQKYPANNYRVGTEWSRYIGAVHRHLNAWQLGEDLDPESGLSHLAHAGACVDMLLTLAMSGAGTDDRFKQEKK